MVRSYEPRRPDFDDVECGLTIGDGGAARTGAGCCCWFTGTVGELGRFREKSGIERLPFFFISTSWVSPARDD
jgi:hypothetical protein